MPKDAGGQEFESEVLKGIFKKKGQNASDVKLPITTPIGVPTVTPADEVRKFLADLDRNDTKPELNNKTVWEQKETIKKKK